MTNEPESSFIRLELFGFAEAEATFFLFFIALTV